MERRCKLRQGNIFYTEDLRIFLNPSRSSFGIFSLFPSKVILKPSWKEHIINLPVFTRLYYHFFVGQRAERCFHRAGIELMYLDKIVEEDYQSFITTKFHTAGYKNIQVLYIRQ